MIILPSVNLNWASIDVTLQGIKWFISFLYKLGCEIHIFIQLDTRERPYMWPVFNNILYEEYIISSCVFVAVNILSHITSLRHHNLLISLRILSRYLYIDDLVYVNSQIFVRTYTHRPASLPPIRYSLTLMYYHIDRADHTNMISRFNKNINKVINITYLAKLDMNSQRCIEFADSGIEFFLVQSE